MATGKLTLTTYLFLVLLIVSSAYSGLPPTQVRDKIGSVHQNVDSSTLQTQDLARHGYTSVIMSKVQQINIRLGGKVISERVRHDETDECCEQWTYERGCVLAECNAKCNKEHGINQLYATCQFPPFNQRTAISTICDCQFSC